MRIEIVEHDTNDACIRIMLRNLFHAVGKFNFGSPLGNRYIPKTALRFTDHH